MLAGNPSQSNINLFWISEQHLKDGINLKTSTELPRNFQSFSFYTLSIVIILVGNCLPVKKYEKLAKKH